jgi:hypothetical protein
MKYAQIKSGNKLHLVYEIPLGGLSDPVCGIKTDHYRMTINVPLGNACKNCRRRLNAKSFDENKFLREYFN